MSRTAAPPTDVVAGVPARSSLRPALLLAAVALLVISLTPPVAALGSRYLVVNGVQYGLVAIVAPLLFVLSSPWQLLGLARDGERRAPDETSASASEEPESIARISLWFVPCLAVLLLWRAPVLVDAAARHHVLLLVEGASLFIAGTAIWVHLAPSPPRYAALLPVARIPVAAVTMWGVWIAAYALGMSTSDPYPAYRVSGRAISLAADKQLSTGVLWFIAGAAFIPVAIRGLVLWLRSDAERLSAAEGH